jgi:hypothetical protein
MPLIQLIVILIVIGLLLWLIETQIPLDPTIKMIIRIVIILAVILWLLSIVGLLPARIGHAATLGRMFARRAVAYLAA